MEHVRFYKEGLSYDNKDPYDAIMTVTWLDDDTISVQGLCGTFSAARRVEFIQHYKERGATKAYYERNGDKVTLHIG